MRYDNADPNVSDSPFLVNNSLYSVFFYWTLSDNGLKTSNADSNFAHKNFIVTEFSNSKGAKAHRSGVRDIVLKTILPR